MLTSLSANSGQVSVKTSSISTVNGRNETVRRDLFAFDVNRIAPKNELLMKGPFTKRQCTNEVQVDPSSSKETERETWSQAAKSPTHCRQLLVT
ncbi:hypothetical protein UPYG_G00019110 [Umbra pygmaea]|uniref:Uncharacterized protein n=1 Tax=Umbra pygmaea TaxID=75934 RepID=A0ABD0Y7N5_UMBPY